MIQHLVLTVIAVDRPGIVDSLASAIRRHNGNWLESSMSRLGGKFAGILLVEIADSEAAALQAELLALKESSISVQTQTAQAETKPELTEVRLSIVANDRSGIVEEMAHVLAASGVNVEYLETCVESAPMSADLLFRAEATLGLPQNMSLQDVTELLEDLSDDLFVEISQD